jgi:hypothetical protein
VRDAGHAAVELALGVAVLMLPVALAVTAFGPWSERRVLAEAAAAEGARTAAIRLDLGEGATVVSRMVGDHGIDHSLVRLGWCGATPVELPTTAGTCSLDRGSNVEIELEVWAPLVTTPWGPVGGLWVGASHSEPIDLYRSLP